MFKIDSFTGIACLLIIVAFAICWYYIATKNAVDIEKKKRRIEQLPSVISTLGVLGTFLGITKGLINFNPGDLDNSIPLLLNGLKTAFFTSLLGMSGSLILSKIVNSKMEKEIHESEIEKAANKIVNELIKHQDGLSEIIRQGNKDLVDVLQKNDTVKAIRQDVEQLKDDLEEIKGLCQEFKNMMENSNKESDQESNEMTDELSRIRAILLTNATSVATIDNNIDDISTAINKLESILSENNDDLNERQVKIAAELARIRGQIETISETIDNGTDKEEK